MQALQMRSLSEECPHSTATSQQVQQIPHCIESHARTEAISGYVVFLMGYTLHAGIADDMAQAELAVKSYLTSSGMRRFKCS